MNTSVRAIAVVVAVSCLLFVGDRLHSRAIGSMDDFIASEMPKAGAPGVAYAVMDGGGIVSGERGEILLGSGRAMTSDTPFVIGSIAKSFTALAMMQLVEAGTVELDSPASEYLEMFANGPARTVTVRQLLSHTSGYSTLQGNDNLIEPSRSADGLGRQVERIAQWALAHQPGTRWEYSNANYYVLGALIERVSGRDYASYIQEEILEPVGMAHSFVADGESHDTIAVGHTPWFGMKRPVKKTATHRMSAPVGGIIASAGDMTRYLAMMMNGEDDIISAAGKAEMMRPAGDVSPFYGFGWYVDPDRGTVSHTGLTPGVETLAIMMPAEQKGAVVLINSGSGMGFGESSTLFNGIAAKALGLDFVEAGAGGRWSRKALFLTFALLPVLFGFSMVQSWRLRTGLRAKSGLFGAFSLWFPLLMTLALAWTCVLLIPQLFGVSIGTLRLFSPDLALVLVASAVTGVTWAVFRLALFYGGKSASG